MLVVTASAPAGVLPAIIAAEYRAAADLASATVFASTVLGPLFVTGVQRAGCRRVECCDLLDADPKLGRADECAGNAASRSHHRCSVETRPGSHR